MHTWAGGGAEVAGGGGLSPSSRRWSGGDTSGRMEEGSLLGFGGDTGGGPGDTLPLWARSAANTHTYALIQLQYKKNSILNTHYFTTDNFISILNRAHPEHTQITNES